MVSEPIEPLKLNSSSSMAWIEASEASQPKPLTASATITDAKMKSLNKLSSNHASPPSAIVSELDIGVITAPPRCTEPQRSSSATFTGRHPPSVASDRDFFKENPKNRDILNRRTAPPRSLASLRSASAVSTGRPPPSTDANSTSGFDNPSIGVENHSIGVLLRRRFLTAEGQRLLSLPNQRPLFCRSDASITLN